LRLSRGITRKLLGALTYRHTLRSADAKAREYNQNLVGLQLTYLLQ
jgi:hypothetical protein